MPSTSSSHPLPFIWILSVVILAGLPVGCTPNNSMPDPAVSDTEVASELAEETSDDGAAHPDTLLQPDAGMQPDSLALSWTISTTEGPYVPLSVIYLNAGGMRFPVASGPGMSDMSGEERERFRAPEEALAATGYGPGFRVNVLVTQEEGLIRVLEAVRDEGTSSQRAYEYEELAAIPVSDIVTARDDLLARPTWLGCFEGQHTVTTSTYDVIVEMGNVTADVSMLIEDQQNAYFTSARASGGGAQIGSRLFMELYLTIEDDVQNYVEIWQLDAEDDPQQLVINGEAFTPCSVE